MRRDVAVVGYAEFETPAENVRNEVEMLMPVVNEALDEVGLEAHDIGFTVSGSSDYLQGYPFAFVHALDAIGPWPPIRESHLEMDGAFALYEAVHVLQHEGIDTALVYAFGKPSRGDLARILALQLDPYVVAPLWPDSASLAQLQAQAMRDSGRYDTVPDAGEQPVSDGCAAVVLAVGDRARELSKRPAWIRGIDHRIEPQALGVRNLTTSESTRLAAQHVGGDEIDEAYLHVEFPHQELVLRQALNLNGAKVHSGTGPTMAGGLMRIGAAARAVMSGDASKVIAHAHAGPCLQQNLVCRLEAAA